MTFRWHLSEYKCLTLFTEEKAEEKSSHCDDQWTDPEICAVIEYIALYHAPNEDGSNVWPIHKRQDFWENCSLAVMQCNAKGKVGEVVIVILF